MTSPPGWLPDPGAERNLRYWDGSAWTPHTIPATAMASPLPAPAKKPRRWSCFGVFIAAMSIFCALVIVVNVIAAQTRDTAPGADDRSASQPEQNAPPVLSADEQSDAHWTAEGYKVVESGSLYIKALDPADFTCGHFACLYYDLHTIDGCPNGAYVEASIESGGVSVGMTNDLTAGLAPGQSAQILLENYEGRGDSFRITDITCR